MLGISLIERGESYYNDIIPIVLNDLVDKNIAVENDGALCIFGSEDDPPLICRKSGCDLAGVLVLISVDNR